MGSETTRPRNVLCLWGEGIIERKDDVKGQEDDGERMTRRISRVSTSHFLVLASPPFLISSYALPFHLPLPLRLKASTLAHNKRLSVQPVHSSNLGFILVGRTYISINLREKIRINTDSDRPLSSSAVTSTFVSNPGTRIVQASLNPNSSTGRYPA